MPLHISEIGVRMAVRDPGTGPPAEGDDASAAQSAELTASQRDSIVEECVRTVLQALRMIGAR